MRSECEPRLSDACALKRLQLLHSRLMGREAKQSEGCKGGLNDTAHDRTNPALSEYEKRLGEGQQ